MLNMQKKFKKINGYSLSEVLVALSLLGVLIAMSVPTLIIESNNREDTVAFLRAYQTIKQTTADIMIHNSGSMEGSASNSATLRDLYCESTANSSNRLNCIRRCNAGAGSGICYAAGYRNLQGTALTDDWSSVYTGAVLNNGMTVLFLGDSIASCNNSGSRLANGCGEIAIDVNGLRMPNRVGRDIFYFQIYNRGIIPDGARGTTTICNTASADGNNGKGCAGRIVNEGNEMNY
jgi:prepilin-type N-terminal cleavage/methylation domain-containing protein